MPPSTGVTSATGSSPATTEPYRRLSLDQQTGTLAESKTPLLDLGPASSEAFKNLVLEKDEPDLSEQAEPHTHQMPDGAPEPAVRMHFPAWAQHTVAVGGGAVLTSVGAWMVNQFSDDPAKGGAGGGLAGAGATILAHEVAQGLQHVLQCCRQAVASRRAEPAAQP
jgi:hypothetical protein